MNAFNKTVVLLLFLTLISASLVSVPKVEMAILLDTSGSMEGLIEQAKSQLWQIVNELAIDLEHIRGDVPEVGERGETGAEVIQTDPAAGLV